LKTSSERRQHLPSEYEGTRVSVQELRRLHSAAAGLGAPPPGIISSLFPGAFRAIYHGRGLEFYEARNYQPGDDFRSLDWRVTARTGKLHTKMFQEEREHTLHLILDAGPSMRFGTRIAFKWVVAARVAALFAWIAVDQGDRVGGMVFGSDRECLTQPPVTGESGVIRLFSLFAGIDESESIGSAGLGMALSRLQHRLSPGSLVLILSDFQSDSENWKAPLSAIARHNEVAAISIFDPLESQLPAAGRYSFSNGSRVLELDTGEPELQTAYHELFQQRQAEAAALLHSHRGSFLTLGTHQDPVTSLRRQLVSKRLA